MYNTRIISSTIVAVYTMLMQLHCDIASYCNRGDLYEHVFKTNGYLKL